MLGSPLFTTTSFGFRAVTLIRSINFSHFIYTTSSIFWITEHSTTYRITKKMLSLQTTRQPLHHLSSSLPRLLPLATKRLLSYTSPIITTRQHLPTPSHSQYSLDPKSYETRRNLHLAPPFLLDTYTPRYLLLSETEASKKRSQAYAHLAKCNLCPRKCGVNRFEKTGWCLIGEKAKVNVIAPHFGEGEFFSLFT